MHKKFDFDYSLKPACLRSDFNGDSIQDMAVFVIEKKSKKKGILLIHGKTNEHFIFGAGTEFGNGSDDFNWADKWKLYKKKTANETKFDKESGDTIGGRKVKLKRPAILIENFEDGALTAGGLIYWNGEKYVWIHQGE